MARVNVESELFMDQRFMDMVLELQSVETAIGALVRCWMIAQKYWANSDNGIPRSEWDKQKLNRALITNGLAEDRGDFIFVVGSEKHFAWIRQRSESGKIGGIRSGNARREIIDENSKRNEAGLSETKRDEASYSFSLSSSSSFSSFDSKNSLQKASKKKGIAEDSPSPTAITWRAYKAAYEKRYGQAPEWNAKMAGQLKHFVSRVPMESAPLIAEFYVTHDDYSYAKGMHPVGLLLRDAEKLSVEWKTKRKSTSFEARQSEKKQTIVNAFSHLLEKKND